MEAGKMIKIAWICPKPRHKVFQNDLMFEAMRKEGFEIQDNFADETTELIVCTSVSQYKRADEYSKSLNKPVLSWVMDITPIGDIMPDFYGYVNHLKGSWKVIAINEAVQEDVMRFVGKHCDVIYPCVDDETIETVRLSMKQNDIKKENKIVVVGSLNHIKKPYDVFNAWKHFKEGSALHGSKLVYVYSTGFYTTQMKRDMLSYGVEFKAHLSDWDKFLEIATAKLLVMPCMYGGFNLPPIEAMFCDTPALVSSDHNFGTFGNHVSYYQTGNVAELHKGMLLAYGQDVDFSTTEYMWKFSVANCADRLSYFIKRNLYELQN